MNRFDGLRHWAWSILTVTALAFALGGCSDGKDGLDGLDGADGADGQPAPVPDAVQASIDAAKIESCSTCHNSAGDEHQNIYDGYTDVSEVGMTLNNLASVLAQRGETERARAILHRALALRGPLHAAVQRSLAELDDQRPRPNAR